MERHVRWLVFAALCLLPGGAFADGARPDGAATRVAATGGAWLDTDRPAAWNLPGDRVPPAPAATGTPADFARCAASLRTSAGREDRAVTKAGWRLFGPLQRFGPTAVVRALSGVDGMCRPLGYQDFVFRNGRFAGTLAPAPMNARTDGASDTIALYEADRITVTYRRYADTDPLCCPSRISTVGFVFAPQGGSAVVPEAVGTRPAGP